uniref:C-type lectin domain-containing protein n=1 Tax=Anopheles maculatus TaxID=74869 RepID=A0A182TBZ9_9DIPT
MKAGLIATAVVALVVVVLPTTHALRYTVHSTPVNFYAAYHQCITKGGYLVAIETAAQNALVVQEIKQAGGTGPWWTSGTDFGMEGAWMWLSRHTGVATIGGYSHFEAGRPVFAPTSGEDCIAISTNGLWTDKSCFDQYPFVCEYYGY